MQCSQPDDVARDARHYPGRLVRDMPPRTEPIDLIRVSKRQIRQHITPTIKAVANPCNWVAEGPQKELSFRSD